MFQQSREKLSFGIILVISFVTRKTYSVQIIEGASSFYCNLSFLFRHWLPVGHPLQTEKMHVWQNEISQLVTCWDSPINMNGLLPVPHWLRCAAQLLKNTMWACPSVSRKDWGMWLKWLLSRHKVKNSEKLRISQNKLENFAVSGTWLQKITADK